LCWSVRSSPYRSVCDQSGLLCAAGPGGLGLFIFRLSGHICTSHCYLNNIRRTLTKLVYIKIIVYSTLRVVVDFICLFRWGIDWLIFK
jgi:hypothetical protein